MAKRSFNKKARALAPAVMKLHYAIPRAGGTSSNYISISNSVSRLNRRFYRQGLNWAVANMKVVLLPKATPGPGVTSVGTEFYASTMPHTWSVANAWMKSFSLWKKQQDEAMANSDSSERIARYRDFKISIDSYHVIGTELQPVSVGPGNAPFPGHIGLQIGNSPLLPSEEWEASQIVLPNLVGPGVTSERTLHMVGPDRLNSLGMIKGYAESRDVPHTPDPVGPDISQSWMSEMFNVGNDLTEITTNAQFNNDELPYDQTAYPGGGNNFINLETQGYVLNQSTVGVNTYNTGPFTAPCGLIRIDINGITTDETLGDYTIITIDLVPGSHRGYLAETMEEF